MMRPKAGCTGRALAGYKRWKIASCSAETCCACSKTSQSTPSEHGGVVSVGEQGRRQQGLQFVVEFAARLDSARGVKAREQRMQALLRELPFDARRDRAGFELGHWRLGKRVERLAAGSAGGLAAKNAPPRGGRRQGGYRICREKCQRQAVIIFPYNDQGFSPEPVDPAVLGPTPTLPFFGERF